MPDVTPTPKSARFKDLTGLKFGRVLIVSYCGRRHHSSVWVGRCDCGAEREFASTALLNGTTKSCGCLRRERAGGLSYKHGQCGGENRKRRPPEYKAWEQMRDRCVNEQHVQWKWYGGKGVVVCDEWVNNFEAFIRDVGPRPTAKHTLDRINSNGNYEPSNVRWATWTQQARNRSNNHMVEYQGRLMPLIEAAEAAGIPYVTVKSRVGSGWSAIDAVTRPVNQKKSDAARRYSKKT